jgi:predicted hotdog family 3-hydroxylacyl-ACP dehydratase
MLKAANPEYLMSQVLPHEGHMLLLDELIEQREDSIVTTVTIRPDSVLCDGVTGVPAWVGMEYMAQTACAYSGVEQARAGIKPSIAVLLGTRAYRTSVPVFPIGARLIVSARLLMRDEDDLVVFQCSIHAGDAQLATGDIKAIRPANLQALIAQQLHKQ